ncbi:hypothetical protein Hanom_Chr09g00786921 [Helianthus anomalus]
MQQEEQTVVVNREDEDMVEQICSWSVDLCFFVLCFSLGSCKYQKHKYGRLL